ncbi:hypothetical protein NU09_2663 [Flavobacterium beibuense]|uniref:Uncharacterized protein n=1 Tax=Flavobacterium beibuense TaxID=657326 RepID=A0A444W7W6_9FLAO|nr:hypothetical protein NU09_2663 [Flavobacterium beibuense]
MAPIRSSVKSNFEIREDMRLSVLGNTLPKTTRNIDTAMAITMIPIVEGSFKNRTLK